MIANNVVLPAPFGPINAMMWPSRAVNETSFTANRPPKRCDMRSTAKSGLPMAGLRKRRRAHHSAPQLRKPTDQAAWRKPDDQHQDTTIHDQIDTGRIAAGHHLCALAQPSHHQCAKEWTDHRTGAADDRRQQSFDRNPGAVSEPGIDEQKILDVETSRGCRDRPRYRHRCNLDRNRVDTER